MQLPQNTEDNFTLYYTDFKRPMYRPFLYRISNQFLIYKLAAEIRFSHYKSISYKTYPQ